MAKARSRSNPPARESTVLRNAIAADTIGVFVDIAVLGPADVALLRRILAGEHDPGYAVSLKRAWGALVRSDPSPETGRLLGRALADRDRPPRDRLAAAVYLGLLPPAAAEAPLLAALPSASGPLRIEILKSLGQVGTARALAQLDRIKADDKDVAKRPLAFARLAIALREGKADRGVGRMGDALGIAWRQTTARALDPRQVRQVQAAFRGPAYGVALDPDMGWRFDCGRRRHVVLLNRALKRGSLVGDLARTGMIAGLVVAQGEKGLKHFTLRWLLLTNPARDGIHVALVRPSGEPAFAGRAVAEGSTLAFTLRDTGRERTPVEISGKVTARDIGWTLRVWTGAVREKPQPRAILPLVVPVIEEPTAEA